MKNEQYYLFLDDIRYPNQITWIDLPLYNWTIARNYKEFVELIKTRGLPNAISFDHDLSIEHHPFSEENGGIPNPTTIPYDRYSEKTGYHCAKWLVDYCLDNNLSLPEYYIHSFNPIGKQNIRALLENFKKNVAKIY
jgi:hypothetical protein